MGIKTLLEPVASVGLGSNSVSVLDMASAYATLAAGGIYSEPMAIRQVVLPNGKVDTEAGWGKPKRKRVFTDGVAYEVTRILEQNMLAGTGTGANFGRPAAGKTGTTDDFADAWFCGYTPTLSTAVWVGYPNGPDPDDERARDRGCRRHVPGDRSGTTSWSRRSAPRPRPTSPLPSQPVESGSRSTASTPTTARRRVSPTAAAEAAAEARRPTRPLRPDRHRGAATETAPPAGTTARAPPATTAPRTVTGDASGRRSQARAAAAPVLGSGLVCLALRRLAVAAAYPEASPLSPDHAGGETKWAWLYLGAVVPRSPPTCSRSCFSVAIARPG